AAEQRGEAGGRVEMRHAEPVDRAVASHERGCLHVADKRIVLDPAGHAAHPLNVQDHVFADVPYPTPRWFRTALAGSSAGVAGAVPNPPRSRFRRAPGGPPGVLATLLFSGRVVCIPRR